MVVREEAWVKDEAEAVGVVICPLFHRQCEFHRVLIKVNDMCFRFKQDVLLYGTSHISHLLGAKCKLVLLTLLSQSLNSLQNLMK